MTTFWSIWVIVLTIACLAICFGLLVWNLKNYVGVEENETCGHEFDGIEEINNPLPKWWTIMFFATFAWGVVYLILYPGMGNFEGISKWTSSNQGIKSIAESKQAVIDSEAAGKRVQLDQEIRNADERFGPVFQQFAQQDIKDLAANEEALEIGQRLFSQNCAQCHGSDARGGQGFPNLTDNDWLYGGSPEAIKQTLLHGRVAAMPAWIDALGEDGVNEVTAYVLSLSGRTVNQKDAAAGQAKFAMCAACHGMDGKGNYAFGAPNLTDNVWLYGGSQRAVKETITNGRAGVMPAWKDILGEDKVHILTAYVYSLSQDK
ncbi:cytochrome-c oxidase, cbb3-type subunit III [Pseudoalteromonas sp. SSM20]|uniref:cytochrome-c oxidase, cbb3-type subunit III n=1 Tax=Pseudoalteromonas sp. SSM20 TaxID=3139394 RepID=UPI003BAC5FB2